MQVGISVVMLVNKIVMTLKTDIAKFSPYGIQKMVRILPAHTTHPVQLSPDLEVREPEFMVSPTILNGRLVAGKPMFYENGRKMNIHLDPITFMTVGRKNGN